MQASDKNLPSVTTNIQEPEQEVHTFKDYIILNMLGKGSYGKVLLVRHKRKHQLFALKIVSKAMLAATQQQKYIQSEKLILQQVRHPFILKLCFSFQSTDKLYLGTEFINGGELFYHMRKEGKFSEDRTKFYAAEIITAVKYLHENDIIYRDLKPENILIDMTGHIRLTDFGLSKMAFSKTTYTALGTPEYIAPEVLGDDGYDQSVDWYSLGILIYEMLVGQPPFYNKDKGKMIQDRMMNDIPFPDYISENAANLIDGLCQIEPYCRLGRMGATELMEHPFFSSINWEMLIKKQIEPPFKPAISGIMDLQNFDKQFTSQPVQEEFFNPDKTNYSNKYNEFTYVNETQQTNVLKLSP